jgi:hypothetical protein
MVDAAEDAETDGPRGESMKWLEEELATASLKRRAKEGA